MALVKAQLARLQEGSTCSLVVTGGCLTDRLFAGIAKLVDDSKKDEGGARTTVREECKKLVEKLLHSALSENSASIGASVPLVHEWTGPLSGVGPSAQELFEELMAGPNAAGGSGLVLQAGWKKGFTPPGADAPLPPAVTVALNTRGSHRAQALAAFMLSVSDELVLNLVKFPGAPLRIKRASVFLGGANPAPSANLLLECLFLYDSVGRKAAALGGALPGRKPATPKKKDAKDDDGAAAAEEAGALLAELGLEPPTKRPRH